MKEQELKKYWEETVKIVCIDGQILQGFICNFTSSKDNESEEASITIENEKSLKRDVVVSLSEIESIEVI
jgi:hypothetical protein